MPSWKIQTSAPKLAVSESRVMITALIGMAIDPNSRNRMIAEASSVVPTAHGIRSDWLTQEVLADGRAAADLHPGRAAASRATARTSEIIAVAAGSAELIGLIASIRTVEPRM